MLYSVQSVSDKGVYQMEFETIVLPKVNKVMHAYNTNKDFLHNYFDYDTGATSYQQRVSELKNRSYKRQQLSEVIYKFMEPFGISSKAKSHIDELANNGIVVVGGQQSGLLTGPLYSIHKAITVILLARQQRKLLNIPVIPVFWVAGEDHDLNEINHVYSEENGRAFKNQYREKYVLKLMASDTEYDLEMMRTFIKEIFGKFGETAHTKDLLHGVLQALERESTFTGFFVRLMNGLFEQEGLLFIDSAFKSLRELEKEYFVKLIEEAEPLAQLIHSKEHQFSEQGLGKPIDAQINAANLFYVHETGRVLLTRQSNDFINDSAGLRFTKAELIEIARRKPWLLSNNVATRPIMQDMVFPVLAFVGGPGEIAYWALLKEAFNHLHMKMPIIIPRMSITLVMPHVKRVLDEKGFSVRDVMEGKVEVAREEFISNLNNEQFEVTLLQTKDMLNAHYDKLAVTVSEDSMQELIKKNLQIHFKQLDYLKEKVDESLLLKYQAKVKGYNLLIGEISPGGNLQERVYTPYSYLNQFGPTLVSEVLAMPMKMDDSHKIIYL